MKNLLLRVLVLSAFLGFSSASADIKVGNEYMFKTDGAIIGSVKIKKIINNGFVTTSFNLTENGETYKVFFVFVRYSLNKGEENIYSVKFFANGEVMQNLIVKENESLDFEGGGINVQTHNFVANNGHQGFISI